jgi:hypothetical protein
MTGFNNTLIALSRHDGKPNEMRPRLSVRR